MLAASMQHTKAPEEAPAAEGEMAIPVGDGKGIILVGPPEDGAAVAAALAWVGTWATGRGSHRVLVPKCLECGKGFGQWLAHQRAQHGDWLGVASGEEPAHICVACSEGATLRRHKKIHEVGAPSVCNSCTQRTSWLAHNLRSVGVRRPCRDRAP